MYQRGMSFSGFILGIFILVLVSMLGLKLIPAYMENGEINKVFSEIANDPDMHSASPHDIRTSFSKHAVIDSITAIKAEDLDIAMDNGTPVLSANYEVKIPLVGNVSLLLDFHPGSAGK